MADKCTIWLPDAESTRSAGVSLASSLYRTDITIGFTGELGSGKTTFLQGFLKGLGVSGTVTSPTYALEQRYDLRNSQFALRTSEVLHIDLYRLDPEKTDEFLHSSDEHTGIRCIEWIDRSSFEPDILIDLQEKDAGRMLTVEFNDIPLPEVSVIEQWREEIVLPERVCQHCDAVAAHAKKLGEMLMDRGIVFRPQATEVSALVHDLLRFIDFVPGAGHGPDEDSTPYQWEYWKKKYDGMGHEAACADLLRERGYPELASIVAVHGCTLPSPDRITTEQKLLFYADKCLKNDEIVTPEERFEDFRKRYADGKSTKNGDMWYAETKAIEKDLGFA